MAEPVKVPESDEPSKRQRTRTPFEDFDHQRQLARLCNMIDHPLTYSDNEIIECINLMHKAGRAVDTPTATRKNIPLHFAVQHQRYAVINALVEAGADVNKCDHTGYRPLVVALQRIFRQHDYAKSPDWTMVNCLCDHGATLPGVDPVVADTLFDALQLHALGCVDGAQRALHLVGQPVDVAAACDALRSALGARTTAIHCDNPDEMRGLDTWLRCKRGASGLVVMFIGLDRMNSKDVQRFKGAINGRQWTCVDKAPCPCDGVLFVTTDGGLSKGFGQAAANHKPETYADLSAEKKVSARSEACNGFAACIEAAGNTWRYGKSNQMMVPVWPPNP